MAQIYYLYRNEHGELCVFYFQNPPHLHVTEFLVPNIKHKKLIGHDW